MSAISGANCSTVPAATASDAGVAGAGVLLSFIVTAGVAILISASIILQDFQRKDASSQSSTIRRKLLNGYSDQQIITGIGIQSVGLAKISTMVPYHFFLIWMLSLLSMATHNATLLALVRDFRRDWVLRWLRQFLMFVNLALSCVYGVFVLQSTSRALPGTLPIECAWSYSGPATAPANSTSGPSAGTAVDNSNKGLAYVGTIIVIAGNVIVFALATWYLHSRAQRFYRTVRAVGLLLMAAIAVGAAVRTLLLSQAFGNPDVPLSDQGEKDWSFGQLLALLLLFLPVISAIEIYRGEVKVAPPVADDDKAPLFDGEMQRNPRHVRDPYEPNPLWGSRSGR